MSDRDSGNFNCVLRKSINKNGRSKFCLSSRGSSVRRQCRTQSTGGTQSMKFGPTQQVNPNLDQAAGFSGESSSTVSNRNNVQLVASDGPERQEQYNAREAVTLNEISANQNPWIDQQEVEPMDWQSDDSSAHEPEDALARIQKLINTLKRLGSDWQERRREEEQLKKILANFEEQILK